MKLIINESILTEDGINFPEHTTTADWQAVHKDLMRCNHMAKRWLKQSRAYGEDKFGTEFVAEWEVQTELELNLPAPKEKPESLNPADKSSVFVSIESIRQQFDLWQRKMVDEIPRWDRPKLTRALELLEPLEQQAASIRRMLNQGQGDE